MSQLTQSSLQAFEVIKATLGKNQAKVLWAINFLNNEHVPASDKQIAELLKWPINRVIPRRSELEKANRIYSIGRMYDGLGSIQVYIWKIRGAL